MTGCRGLGVVGIDTPTPNLQKVGGQAEDFYTYNLHSKPLLFYSPQTNSLGYMR